MKSLLIIAGILCVPTVAAKPISSKQLDKVAQRVLEEYRVPGAVVGIVQHGKVVQAKSYGVKNIQTGEKVDEFTLFKIASNSKAFTTAALAILVDEGKIRWDDKVVKYLPDFKLHDPWITAHFNIIDLLTHRSGLGLGAGDLMIWPKPSTFSRQEVIHNLRYLQPAGEFRANYAYDNLLYIVAGEIVPAVTGMQWEDFVEQRIMRPLGMQHCFAGKVAREQLADVAKPHGVIEGKLQVIDRPEREGPAVASAAGGIKCSLHDILLWLQMHLDEGQFGDNKQLISAQQHQMLWSPQTIMPLYDSDKRLNNSHFSSYALGWRLNDMNGYLRVHHTGSLAGMYSYVSFIPELDLGVVVLLNQQSSGARNALMYSVLKSYLPVEKHDWVKEFLPKSRTKTSDNKQPVQSTKTVYVLDKQTKLSQYAGRYQDNWLGEFSVVLENNALVMRSKRVPKFVGSMTPIAPNQFVVRWYDRSLEADAIATFFADEEGVFNSMKLLPESEDIDFSYDFQDLDFQRTE
ncbi:serine hydrolase [Neptunicella marina]|uniref:Serine hydrolase n=2 Tax=Neptunicella marina TaxID=2125989 RepID=A0A8J6IRW8_9ALTE|nr:serine hydrolase [Neptunicella marina]